MTLSLCVLSVLTLSSATAADPTVRSSLPAVSFHANDADDFAYYWSEDRSCPDTSGTLIAPRTCTLMVESPEGDLVEMLGTQECEVDVSFHYEWTGETWVTGERRPFMRTEFTTVYNCEPDGSYTTHPSDDDECSPCRVEGRE